MSTTVDRLQEARDQAAKASAIADRLQAEIEAAEEQQRREQHERVLVGSQRIVDEWPARQRELIQQLQAARQAFERSGRDGLAESAARYLAWAAAGGALYAAHQSYIQARSQIDPLYFEKHGHPSLPGAVEVPPFHDALDRCLAVAVSAVVGEAEDAEQTRREAILYGEGNDDGR